ncbi:MAG: VTC domain-containing protein [Planctomycetes bacterium]|nr:VTC domain-containing protein [Planctomycetota bacterium]
MIAEALRPLVLRHERKFVARGVVVGQVLAAVRLHPWNFRTAHPPRHVNNLYLDTPDLATYRANVDGLALRVKFRLRWYGEPRGEVRPTLEAKCREGELNGKRSWAAGPLRVDRDLDSAGVRRSLEAAGAGPVLAGLFRELVPVLVNRYHRHYLVSADGVRLTLDDGLVAHRLWPWPRLDTDLRRPAGRVIIELKYPEGRSPSAEGFRLGLPLRLERSSKYASALEAFLAVMA